MSRVHSDSTLPPVMDNVGVVSPPESYLFHSIEPQKISLEPGNESETTLSPSPAHSLDAELDIPMETDIDDFQEEDVLPGRGRANHQRAAVLRSAGDGAGDGHRHVGGGERRREAESGGALPPEQ
ncbi:hypothetical protein KUCAC02_035335 [Chaenocephalus aceratus]|nr:hypothetical protein KUCAC02_035335 [Chaenocephalus aceratus]